MLNGYDLECIIEGKKLEPSCFEPTLVLILFTHAYLTNILGLKTIHRRNLVGGEDGGGGGWGAIVDLN
jgi:hypothetical protein